MLKKISSTRISSWSHNNQQCIINLQNKFVLCARKHTGYNSLVVPILLFFFFFIFKLYSSYSLVIILVTGYYSVRGYLP